MSSESKAVRKQSDILIFPDDLRVADESVNEFVALAMNICAAGEYEAFRLLWSVREDPLPRDEFEQGWQAVERIRIRALRKARLILPPGENDPGAALPEPQARNDESSTSAGAISESGSDSPPTANHPPTAEPRELASTGLQRLEGDAQPPAAADEPRQEGETVYLVLAEVRFDPEHPAGKQQADRDVVLMLVAERGKWRIAHPPKIMREWMRKHGETGQPRRDVPLTDEHRHD